MLLLISLLMAVGMYCFFWNVVTPAQEARFLLKSGPRGNLSDLYPRWLGARELLLNDRDPYSPDVTAEIQRGVFGRTIDPEDPSGPHDQARFAYPLYVVFLLAPAVALPFPVVEVLFLAIAIIAAAGSVFLLQRCFSRTKSGFLAALVTVLFLGSYSFVSALHVEQLALIVLPLIVGGIIAVASGRLRAGGIMLALATIKPQSAAGIVAWLLLWAVSRWKDRKSLVMSFGLTLFAMLAGAELLLPGWVWKWREALSAYVSYAAIPGPHVEIIFGDRPGKVIAALVVLGIGIFCWKARKDEVGTDRFKFAPALILSANLVVNPIWRAYDHIFLLPVVLLIVEWKAQFFRLNPISRAIVRLSAVALIWQWPAAAAVAAVSLVSPTFASNLQIVPWLSIFFVPPLALVSLVLIGRAQLADRVGEGGTAVASRDGRATAIPVSEPAMFVPSSFVPHEESLSRRHTPARSKP